jgi:hypothetical protein
VAIIASVRQFDPVRVFIFSLVLFRKNFFKPMRLLRLGIANALLLGSIFLPQFSNWREPMNFASIGVLGVLGLLAAHRDRRLVAEDDL